MIWHDLGCMIWLDIETGHHNIPNGLCSHVFNVHLSWHWSDMMFSFQPFDKDIFHIIRMKRYRNDLRGYFDLGSRYNDYSGKPHKLVRVLCLWCCVHFFKALGILPKNSITINFIQHKSNKFAFVLLLFHFEIVVFSCACWFFDWYIKHTIHKLMVPLSRFFFTVFTDSD